jgi:hypothetical protein
MRVNVMLNLFQYPIKIKKEILKRVQDDNNNICYGDDNNTFHAELVSASQRDPEINSG